MPSESPFCSISGVFFLFFCFFSLLKKKLIMVKYALQGPECMTENLNKEASRTQYLGMESKVDAQQLFTLLRKQIGFPFVKYRALKVTKTQA